MQAGAPCKSALSLTCAEEAREDYLKPAFQCSNCLVGVLRHKIRTSATYHRAASSTAQQGQQLFAAVAADRCTNLPLHVTYQQLAEVHSLSATGHRSNVLHLHLSAPVLLEDKLSAELGVVRGCPCIVCPTHHFRSFLSLSEPGCSIPPVSTPLALSHACWPCLASP